MNKLPKKASGPDLDHAKLCQGFYHTLAKGDVRFQLNEYQLDIVYKYFSALADKLVKIFHFLIWWLANRHAVDWDGVKLQL